MAVTLSAQNIVTAAALLAAVIAIIGYFAKAHDWFLKQKKQDQDIKELKDENALICYALSAVLDGLIQMGANHTVPVAKEKLDKHLNLAAHK